MAHISALSQFGMHAQGGLYGVRSLCLAICQFQVIPQQLFVIRVCAVLDDSLCAFLRAFAAQVGHTLLGNDDVDIMFRMVVV